MTNVDKTMIRFEASGFTKEIKTATKSHAKPIAFESRPIWLNDGSVGSE